MTARRTLTALVVTLILVMSCCAAVIGLQAASADPTDPNGIEASSVRGEGSASATSADARPGGPATFYGTTGITVPAGTAVDYERDARFRLFARDAEDADYTSRMTATTSPAFDAGSPLEAGSYEISYSVRADDGETYAITVPVTVVDGSQEVVLERTMYTIPSVKHLNDLGYTRGNNMDRQIVGLFLDEGAAPGDGSGATSVPSIQMRKLSGAQDLTVTFRNNNGWCESDAKVTGTADPSTEDGWVTLRNAPTGTPDGSLESAVFVKTLSAEPGPVTYEVKWDASDPRIQPLHYYHEGDGADREAVFIGEWQDDAGSYGVVDGVAVTVLMPHADASEVMGQLKGKRLDTLDAALAFWTSATSIYDSLIGISYDAEKPWDKAVRAKYFARANAHGAGAAFYGGDCIGVNAATKAWNLLLPQWGTFHEYGHGYQGRLGKSDDTGVNLTEVAVNIFSFYITEVSEHSARYNTHWIGDIDSKEAAWQEKRRQGLDFVDSTIGSDTALYALVNMLYSTDDYLGTYAYINQYYRAYYAENGKTLPIFDAWTLAYEERLGLDLVPYIESWNLTVSDDVKDRIMASDATPFYYISEMVGDPATATELKETYGERGEYDLIRMDELASAGLDDATVRLTFRIDDFSAIEGKELAINSGDDRVRTVTVTEPVMEVELPAGTYKAAPPRSDVPCDVDRLYIVAKSGATNEYEVVYTPIDSISKGNDVIVYCRGYWGEDPNYRPFTIQVKGTDMVFDYRGTQTNSNAFSPSETFAKLTLCDASGNVVYEKGVNGGRTDLFSSTNSSQAVKPVEPGYELTVYYRNPSDLRFVSQLTGKAVDGFGITDPSCTRTYVVTEYGLFPKDSLESDPDAAYEAYESRIRESYDELVSRVGTEGLTDPFGPSYRTVNGLTALAKSLRPEDQERYVGTLLSAPSTDDGDGSGDDGAGNGGEGGSDDGNGANGGNGGSDSDGGNGSSGSDGGNDGNSGNGAPDSDGGNGGSGSENAGSGSSGSGDSGSGSDGNGTGDASDDHGGDKGPGSVGGSGSGDADKGPEGETGNGSGSNDAGGEGAHGSEDGSDAGSDDGSNGAVDDPDPTDGHPRQDSSDLSTTGDDTGMTVAMLAAVLALLTLTTTFVLRRSTTTACDR